MTAARVDTGRAEQLLELARSTPQPQLLDLVRDLERARDAAIARVLEQREPRRLLTLEAAAELVSLPARRLRSLARAKPWALRIGHSLRVDEAAFIEWARSAQCSWRVVEPLGTLTTRRRDVRGAHKNAPKRTR